MEQIFISYLANTKLDWQFSLSIIVCLTVVGHYDGKPMPSAGPLPFIQGVFCTYNNTCHQTMTADEAPGTLETFDTSL